MDNKQYSFKRDSEVYVIKEGVGYQIGTLSNFSASQTVSEKTMNRKTQFTRLAPKGIINRLKNTGSGSLEFYYSSNCIGIQYIFEALDFEYLNNHFYSFDNLYRTQPENLTLALFNRGSNRWITLKDCVIGNLDMGFSPSSINLINLGFSFSDMTEENPNAIMQRDTTSVIKAPKFIQMNVDGATINAVKTASFTITRSVRWSTNGANQFNIGSVGISDKPYITDYDITAMATINDVVSDIILDSTAPKTSNILLGNDVFSITIPEARITTRRESTDIQTLGVDIKHQSIQNIILGGNTYG